MAATALDPNKSLTKPLLVSAGGHALVLVFLLVSFHQHFRGEPWGGPGGGAIQVSVVRSLPGVPLPRPAVVAEGRGATDVPGLHPSQPKKAEPQKEELAKERPRSGEDPRQQPAPPRQKDRPTCLAPGAIPSAGGGPVALPYTSFQTGGAEGGMSFGSVVAFGRRHPSSFQSWQPRLI